MKHTWFLDNTIGINEGFRDSYDHLVCCSDQLSERMSGKASGYQADDSVSRFLALIGATVLIRLTADQFRLYMNFKTAEVTALVFLVFIFIDRKMLLWECCGSN